MADYKHNLKFGDYSLRIKDDGEVVLLEAFKDGEKLAKNAVCSYIEILVTHKPTNKSALYFHNFKKIVTVATVERYIEKFLTDESVRQLAPGSTVDILAGVVKKVKEKGTVDIRCQRQIDSLNNRNMSKLKFKDFMALKTYGRDKYSNIKLEVLQQIVSSDIVQIALKEFPEDKANQTTMLRWICRGLHVDKAIRKVKTDMEVSLNAQGKPFK